MSPPEGGERRRRRPPDGAEEGDFTCAEHSGHRWRHAATVETSDIARDAEGSLRGFRVGKFHEARDNARPKASVLVSPEGDPNVRVSRDLARTQETPTVPASWRRVEHMTEAPLSTAAVRCGWHRHALPVGRGLPCVNPAEEASREMEAVIKTKRRFKAEIVPASRSGLSSRSSSGDPNWSSTA